MDSSGSSRPLVGLTTYIEPARHGAWDEVSAILPMAYVSAVIRAGGCPILLPPSPSDPVDVLVAVSGLVVTGGPDVDPRRYGATAHPRTDRPRPERDEWEFALCQAAVSMDLPLLAICRGLQVLNVARGGTLHQHLEDVTANTDHRVAIGQMSSNAIVVDPGTAMADILGTETVGMCHHHQAIDRVGDGLQVVARAADGVIEAVEMPGRNFVVGVQWHPEDTPGDDGLFEAVVAAARLRCEARA